MNIRQSLARGFVLTSLLLSAAGTASAQATAGSIGGSVVDPSGAAIVDAHLTVTSVDRGVSTTVESGSDGHYVADALVPGEYAVHAERTGFKTAVVGSVHVGVDARTKVDIHLQLGGVSESVEVQP